MNFCFRLLQESHREASAELKTKFPVLLNIGTKTMLFTERFCRERKEVQVGDLDIFRGSHLPIVVNNGGHAESGCKRLVVNGQEMETIIFRRIY